MYNTGPQLALNKTGQIQSWQCAQHGCKQSQTEAHEKFYQYWEGLPGLNHADIGSETLQEDDLRFLQQNCGAPEEGICWKKYMSHNRSMNSSRGSV